MTKGIKVSASAGPWAEGRHMDLWSLVHFLCGGVLAGICFFLGFNLINSTIITFAILMGWEIIEMIMGVKEIPTNILSDMIVGMAGFFAMWFSMESHIFNNICLMTIITALFLIFDLKGFLAYTGRKKKIKNWAIKLFK